MLIVEPTDVSYGFWTGGAQGRLLIHRCARCDRWFHPPGLVCIHCRSREVAPNAVSGRATLAAFTVNYYEWSARFPPPYVVAIVELDEDPLVRLTTNIVNCKFEQLKVGMQMIVAFRRDGDMWLPLFEPKMK